VASKNSKHTHKYYKAYSTDKRSFLWTCPDCQHHMPKHYEHTLPGRLTQCWGHDKDCEKSTVLDSRTLVMDKPLCTVCDPDYIAPEVDSNVLDYLKDIGAIDKLE
jgi:hypothetical protein